MAISRGSMTKEMFGNRQKAKKPKKMALGGTPTPSDMMNERGRGIAAMAQQGGMRGATSAPSRITPGGMGMMGKGMMPPRGMGMMGKGPTSQTIKPAMAVPSMGGTPSQSQMLAQARAEQMQQGVPMETPTGTPVRDPNAPLPSRALPMMKKGGVVKKAKGGSVRGCGCAIRGKNGAKVY